MVKSAHALIGALLAAGCSTSHPVKVNFGTNGEGLDGFMCKLADGGHLLERLAVPDGGVMMASIITDFVKLDGLPGCRTGQLVAWCATRDCTPLPATRKCTNVELPTRVGSLSRSDLRALILTKLKALDGGTISADGPDEFVMLRVIASAQPCPELIVPPSGDLPAYDRAKLVGCAYSCPALFDHVGQDVYLGFDTLENECEHGVRTCADNALKWAP